MKPHSRFFTSFRVDRIKCVVIVFPSQRGNSFEDSLKEGGLLVVNGTGR